VGLAADATSFSPEPVEIKALKSDIPVGSIMIWPSAENPPDYEKYMDCDGRAITQTEYPELYAQYGGNIPDMRGMFLRGVGGKSGALGELQAEGVYIDPSTAKISIGGGVGHIIMQSHTSYVIQTGYGIMTAIAKASSGSNPRDPMELVKTGSMVELPVKLSVSGADETRPVNKAVRYLVRALP
jgi:hypothetical protein